MADLKIQELTDSLKEYVNLRYDLVRLELTKKISNIGADSVRRLIIVLVGVMLLLFLSTSAGLFLADYYHSYATGFLLVALFYLVLLILLALFSKRLIRDTLRNKLVEELLKDEVEK